MVEFHKMILPFKSWAIVTVGAFSLCLIFAIIGVVRNAPEEPTVIEGTVETVEAEIPELPIEVLAEVAE